MNRKMLKKILCSFCFSLMFLSKGALSAYIEGTDTTDVNGNSRDSAFNVAANGIISTRSLGFEVYGLNGSDKGLFNYSFDDIQIAFIPMISTYYYDPDIIYTCFDLKKMDSTYSKIQILSKLADKRYVFKYGTNTTPNDRMLVKADYDRSVRYKPNNVFSKLVYDDTLFWEPPLPNINHLMGYILYATKRNERIDTTAPINLAQWDSIAFSSSNYIVIYPDFFELIQGTYLNLVAVYSEGKSDFLQGWTFYKLTSVGISTPFSGQNKFQRKMQIKKGVSGYYINFQTSPGHNLPLSLAIFNVTGRQIARFPSIKTNRVLWTPSPQNFAGGLCIAKAEFPDGSVVSQPFVVSR